MYYFEKIDMSGLGKSADFAGVLRHAVKCFGLSALVDLFALAAKFRRQLFDDYSFIIAEKSAYEADFESALRLVDVMCECGENFYVVKAESGEIAGFWYIYGINYERKIDVELENGEVKKPVTGTIAGCLKKKFWGYGAREIMQKVLQEIFTEMKFEKIKCETFSTNPYIERLLRDFEFDCEGILKNETKAAGRLCDVKIWGLQRKNWHKKSENIEI